MQFIIKPVKISFNIFLQLEEITKTNKRKTLETTTAEQTLKKTLKEK